jgi:ferritin
MLSAKMEKAFNEQIKWELYSSYLYMSMATYCEALPMPGFAHWLKVQVQEELSHVLKMNQFVSERGGRVRLMAIDGPPTDWDSPLAVAKQVQEHEKVVSKRINDLVDLAQAEKDHASFSFLQWFVNEQVEEEASAQDLVGQLKMVENAAGGLFMLDKELAARVFTMPVGVTI